MKSTTSLAILSLAAGALAFSNDHGHFQRSHRMKRIPKKRSEVVIAYYGKQNGIPGSCGEVHQDSDFIVGLPMSVVNSNNTAKCGSEVIVTLADDTSKSVKVTTADTCDCEKDAIYLSEAAFTALAGSLTPGELNVTWTFSDSVSASGSGSSSSSTDSGSSGDSGSSKDSGSTSSGSSTDSGSSDSGVSSSSTSSIDSTSSTTVVHHKGSSATPVSPGSSSASSSTSEPTSTSSTKSKTKTKTKAQPEATSTSSSAAAASSSSSSSGNKAGGTSSDGWKNTKYLTGDALFDAFEFITGPSDNGGVARYVSRDSGLVWTDDDGNAVISVDQSDDVDLRKSISMYGKDLLNPGFMVIVDVISMPAFCGAWPAIWLNGECDAGWPECGEIDLIEGVNLYEQNVQSIHTGAGCSLTQDTVSSLTKATLKEDTLNCNANDDPASCGFNDNSKKSYGEPFNNAGGGVFAVSATSDGINFYFFSRGDVPSDITNNSPTPSTWGSPTIAITNDACDIDDHFKDMAIVINTNLGGTFPEGVWNIEGNGQDTSCADLTGVDSAAAYIQGKGSDFSSTWTIASLAIYKQ